MNNESTTYLLECLKSFKGIRSNAEKAMAQLSETEFHFQPDPESNSVAMLIRHLAGNMRSRFTDFLTTDGEKPDRDRDSEFVRSDESSAALMKRWNEGWDLLLETLQSLRPEDLLKTVSIRGEPHTVLRAINRSLSTMPTTVARSFICAK